MIKNKQKITPDIWRQMVRDYEGRWTKYVGIKSSYSDSTYFWGKQDWKYYTKNRKNIEIKKLIESNLGGLNYLEKNISKIKNMSFYLDYLEWLRDLRESMGRSDKRDELHWTYLDPTSKHTVVVFGDIIPLAKKLGDPYPISMNGPIFENIPIAGLPGDIFVSPNKVRHYYPHPQYYPDYLRESLKVLKKIVSKKGNTSDIAYFYQISINMHLFELGNNSLFMNIVNYLLTNMKLKGIEHGILDFVSFRLQPNNFAQYFEKEVRRVQK